MSMYFALLDGNEYSVHPGLNAIDLEDIQEILGVLKKTKILIE